MLRRSLVSHWTRTEFNFIVVVQFLFLGFDAHGGGSHPVIEGIVICQEFEQTLREAIEQQKQISIEKELKKKEERIYKNWRKLIRGVVIRENLAKKYADKPCSNNETQPPMSTMDDDEEYL